jgi:hypothetical protein
MEKEYKEIHRFLFLYGLNYFPWRLGPWSNKVTFYFTSIAISGFVDSTAESGLQASTNIQ